MKKLKQKEMQIFLEILDEQNLLLFKEFRSNILKSGHPKLNEMLLKGGSAVAVSQSDIFYLPKSKFKSFHLISSLFSKNRVFLGKI